MAEHMLAFRLNSGGRLAGRKTALALAVGKHAVLPEHALVGLVKRLIGMKPKLGMRKIAALVGALVLNGQCYAETLAWCQYDPEHRVTGYRLFVDCERKDKSRCRVRTYRSPKVLARKSVALPFLSPGIHRLSMIALARQVKSPKSAVLKIRICRGRYSLKSRVCEPLPAPVSCAD